MENKNHSEIAPAVECKPAGSEPEAVVHIVAQWAPRHDTDADVTRCIAEVSDVGDGDILIEVGDTAIWIPRWQLCGALNALHIWRE